MQIIKKAFDWVVLSSADPRKVSLTIKAALLMFIPYLMQALGIACQFGYQCTDLDPTLLNTIVDVFADAVFYGLSLVSALGVLIGLVRKLWRTVVGTNKVLW